jgi:hypothetical protein
MTAIRTWLDNALIQSAAECYLDVIGPDDYGNKELIKRALMLGVNDRHEIFSTPSLPGATRFTETQADWFTTHYTIVTHYPNDATGFSCTLFKNNDTGEYTLSFRSTEYALENKGGDYSRDGTSGADGDISKYGFALSQINSPHKTH